jgi:hypothetical protein
MLKILPALGTVAIIAFSIGYNTARYPSVWEMVGPSAHLPEESSSTDASTVTQSEKAVNPATSAPGANPHPILSVDNSLQRDTGIEIRATENSVPEGIMGEDGSPEPNLVIAGPPGTPPPATRLVPVPDNIFMSDSERAAEQYPDVQRLPPVYQASPIPAGHYAAEYPQSPIPIYPSTGIE